MVLFTSVLHNGTVSLYCSWGTCPCFPCWCISSLYFSLTSRSCLSHASLLPSLPYFLCLGLTGSWTLQKISLIVCPFCSAPHPQEQFPEGSYQTAWKAGILLGPNFPPYLPRVPQGCELHWCLLTAAQPASNPDVPNQLTHISIIAFPLGGLSIAWLRKLSWFKTVSGELQNLFPDLIFNKSLSTNKKKWIWEKQKAEKTNAKQSLCLSQRPQSKKVCLGSFSFVKGIPQAFLFLASAPGFKETVTILGIDIQGIKHFGLPRTEVILHAFQDFFGLPTDLDFLELLELKKLGFFKCS